MRPSKLKAGDRLMVRPALGGGAELEAYFVRREPAKGKGCPAKNTLRFPDFAGLDGPHDDGTATLSDYELSRNGRLAGELRHE
jgi:hypothetical protein